MLVMPRGSDGWLGLPTCALSQRELQSAPIEVLGTHGDLHGQSPEHFPNLPATQKQGLSAVVANGDPTSMGLG